MTKQKKYQVICTVQDTKLWSEHDYAPYAMSQVRTWRELYPDSEIIVRNLVTGDWAKVD